MLQKFWQSVEIMHAGEAQASEQMETFVSIWQKSVVVLEYFSSWTYDLYALNKDVKILGNSLVLVADEEKNI